MSGPGRSRGHTGTVEVRAPCDRTPRSQPDAKFERRQQGADEPDRQHRLRRGNRGIRRGRRELTTNRARWELLGVEVDVVARRVVDDRLPRLYEPIRPGLRPADAGGRPGQEVGGG